MWSAGSICHASYYMTNILLTHLLPAAVNAFASHQGISTQELLYDRGMLQQILEHHVFVDVPFNLPTGPTNFTAHSSAGTTGTFYISSLNNVAVSGPWASEPTNVTVMKPMLACNARVRSVTEMSMQPRLSLPDVSTVQGYLVWSLCWPRRAVTQLEDALLNAACEIRTSVKI
jgi:hypothetical protein